MFRLTVAALLVVATVATPFESTLDDVWEKFKVKYGKQYGPLEEKARRLVWEQHVMDIARHNLEANIGMHSFFLGLNQFSDRSQGEIVRLANLGQNTRNQTGSAFLPYYHVELPDNVDWRKEGLVGPVQDGGACCPSWAIAVVGTLQGQNKKKTGRLVLLSTANLAECATEGKQSGCTGSLAGGMDAAYDYVKKNGGIDTAGGYPDKSCEGTKCMFDPSKVGATCTGHVDIPSGDEDALKKAVAEVGPVAACIDASQISFQLYVSGIYDEPNCSATIVDHCALIVGYGTLDGKDYWLVQNSWGTSWGEDGYIMMSRNKNNQCGIATMASYPLM